MEQIKFYAGSILIVLTLFIFLYIVYDKTSKTNNEELVVRSVETLVYAGNTCYKVITENKKVIVLRAFNNKEPIIGDVIKLGGLNYAYFGDLE